MSEGDMLFKKDAQFQLELDPVGAENVFTNLCGVTEVTFNSTNEIIEIKDGNCVDPNAAVQVISNYGARSGSIVVNFNAYKSVLPTITDWDVNQKRLKGRINFPNAASGELQYIDAVLLLESWDGSGIQNLDGNQVAGSMNLSASGGLSYTIAP